MRRIASYAKSTPPMQQRKVSRKPHIALSPELASATCAGASEPIEISSQNAIYDAGRAP